MRIAFTIILNGEHHLKHNKYALYLRDILDYWVIVEGATKSGGSTKWCKEMPSKYHDNGHSVDDTVEILQNLESDKVRLVFKNGLWDSKDQMVNAALDEIIKIPEVKKSKDKFLWEIDIDEQWTRKNMALAEATLYERGATCGEFLSNFYVGKDLIAKGEWGEGKLLPYRRLWIWNGEKFKTHEPPQLDREEIITLLPQRFNHYAYYFEQDVKFKNDWYSGHEYIHERWAKIQKRNVFPCKISELITGKWGETDTVIVKREKYDFMRYR